ncbi:hypothetical protein [Salmonirosea aquatica]|uniref:Uncharacterized protein n=1 Tax=Salmonirosea aquatica TaxID=2654236 RepID=A0A7C9BD21_9BACT|nr:hypothetical protein [Cytophagaceae bacterium SJW1-29]
MQKSNKILISVVSLFTIVTLGCNVILKAQYDKIDFDDPYHGYGTEIVSPFKHVVLSGTGRGLTQILPGREFQIKTTLSERALNWKVEGDTLRVDLARNLNENNWAPNDLSKAEPVAFIIAPRVSGVYSTGVNCKVSDLKNERFTLRQEKSRVLLVNNSIQNLTAQVVLGSSLTIDQKSRIDTAAISLNDSSRLTAADDNFKRFQLQADESAHLELPMSLINIISKKQ